MIVRCERHPQAMLPERAHDGDSGSDLRSMEAAVVYIGDTVKIRTGICVELPDGYEAQVRPRSGHSSKGHLVHFGTVDCGYRGEIGVVVTNLSETPWHIMAGDKIAQLVVAPVVRVVFREAAGSISRGTERGVDGFGSTGS